MRTDPQLLRALIEIAEIVTARQFEALDQVEPLAGLSSDLQRLMALPTDRERVVDVAELILFMALQQLAGGDARGMARLRYRDIALHALQMTRAHELVALMQQLGID